MTLESQKIRSMIRRDIPEVLNIESLCFDWPWNEEDFISCLRQRNVMALVAELNQQVASYMIYELHEKSIHLVSIAVHVQLQGRGLGSALMHRLTSKLSNERRNQITLNVRETNLQAQMFFRSLGFVATEVISGLYDSTCEDAYRFIFRCEWAPGAAV